MHTQHGCHKRAAQQLQCPTCTLGCVTGETLLAKELLLWAAAQSAAAATSPTGCKDCVLDGGRLLMRGSLLCCFCSAASWLSRLNCVMWASSLNSAGLASILSQDTCRQRGRQYNDMSRHHDTVLPDLQWCLQVT
jgi:hypothetical protein